MKKAVALAAVLVAAACALAFYLVKSGAGGVNNSRDIKLAYQAMEDGNYERARRLYGFAVKNGSAGEKDMEIYELLGAYLDAADALKKENFSEGIDIIDSVKYNYTGLSIREDMDALRIALIHGLTVDNLLDSMEKAIKDKKLSSAKDAAEEVSRLELTENQRERYFSLSRAMNADGEDETETLIYYVDSEGGEASLYSDASASSDVICAIPNGEAVEVLELTENGFVKVLYERNDGYLPFRCLSPNRTYRDEDEEPVDGDKDESDGDGKDSAEKEDGVPVIAEPAEEGGSDNDKDGGSALWEDYTVRVDPDSLSGKKLSIRSGPGASYPVAGEITSPMVLTVVEEKDGWGRLKSGAGWIELAYCDKVG